MLKRKFPSTDKPLKKARGLFLEFYVIYSTKETKAVNFTFTTLWKL